jgi:uncharacterized SAM-binding protein YcdF (DUF218 family)
MDFFLKKSISFFVEPLGMIMLFLVLGLFFLFRNNNKMAKIFTSVSFVLLLLYSNPPFANFLVSPLEKGYRKYDQNKSVRYIHVLGSGHRMNNDQPISSCLTEAGTKRVLEGVSIYKKIPNSKIVFTGYKGNTTTPIAVINKNFALYLGADEKDIIMGKYARDTQEEVNFMKKLLKKDEEFILVTSASHMPRAIALYEAVGLHPIPAPTDYHKSISRGLDSPPDISSMNVSQIAIHEYLGIAWNTLKQFLH